MLNQLLSWIRLHFVQGKTQMTEILAADQPHTHPAYWDTVSYTVI